MTDPTEAAKSIGARLKGALEQPTPARPLRRHRDDDYWDEVVILAGTTTLRGSIVPRYKTSGLSGDEWRVSARLVVKEYGRTILDQPFHRMSQLLTHAPGFIYVWRHSLQQGTGPTATLVAKRKGHVLCEIASPNFMDAAMGMYRSIIRANEGMEGVLWRHVTDAEERAHCQQVGCADEPVNVYRLKKILYGEDTERAFLPPQYDFEGQYTWYCPRHATRGDCGIEDADGNLELVEGDGRPRPVKEDESPSVTAPPIRVRLPKLEGRKR